MKEYVYSVWRVCWPDTEVQRCITKDRFILLKAMQILQYPVNPMFDQSASVLTVCYNISYYLMWTSVYVCVKFLSNEIYNSCFTLFYIA